MKSALDMLRKARSALLRRGVSVDDVDDLVHDAFVKVEHYEKGQIVRHREALLVRTALNLSTDAARRKQRSPFVTLSTGLEYIIDPCPQQEEILSVRDRLRRANEGLNRLNLQTRRILLARRLDNKSVAEIAKQEGMSVAAVEKQIARATLSLMKWMDGW
ncbi:RNA polymerase sigma factor [Sphingobium phenoxybenzoativorans]|uniref:RNA polymerase sigma factor n=1 Tax=Sphingobium phenoxybenzoativorans TaxID=1592790 RepID=UPI0008720CC1|nr:sigma-70 family RNA polymerase sigma factor [Sphingobium phenoxybenzoativorans]